MSSSLVVSRNRLSTVDDRAFPVAAARWKKWEWDLSFRWKWELTEMGGNWYEKSVPAHL